MGWWLSAPLRARICRVIGAVWLVDGCVGPVGVLAAHAARTGSAQLL
jgi:hypothetical protein